MYNILKNKKFVIQYRKLVEFMVDPSCGINISTPPDPNIPHRVTRIVWYLRYYAIESLSRGYPFLTEVRNLLLCTYVTIGQ